MQKIAIALGTFVFTLVVAAGVSMLSALFLWLVWNGTVAELFPRAVGYVPAVITFWQAFKLMFLLAVIGRAATPEVSVKAS